MTKIIAKLASLTIVLSLTACASTADPVKVYINSGAKQCLGLGKSLEQTSAILTEAGIDNGAAECGKQQGVLFPAVCGGGTPDVNIHEIDKSDLEQAKQLGFKSVAETDIELGKCETKKPVKRPSNRY